jgi:hypothetical protein
MEQAVTMVLQFAGLLVGGVTALIAGLLRRSIGDLDTKLAEVAGDVKEIRTETGKHAQELARGDERMRHIEMKLDGLEARLYAHMQNEERRP